MGWVNKEDVSQELIVACLPIRLCGVKYAVEENALD